MHEQGEKGAAPAPSTAGAVAPSAVESRPILSNPAGFTFIIGEIAARNPTVQQALTRRAGGWTG